MHLKKLAICASAGIMALVVACGKNSPSPVSPSAAEQAAAGAAADGSTLKATAPNPVSPVSGAQPDGQLVLIASKSQAKFSDFALSYQFQVRSGSTVVYDSGVIGGVGSGPNNVQHSPGLLTPDTNYTWRARAAYQGAFGPWSSDASFKSPIGGYIRGNEVFDPLTGGKTAGEIRGPVQFASGVGATLVGHESHILYRLPVNLQQGEFSMMIQGADEGSEGDKSKVFAMQEGPDEGDITDDDYRFTAELRGRNYGAPGSVTYRIIAGDGVSRDGGRSQLNFNSSRWYFWRFTWRTGSARLEVKEDNENGRTIYDSSIGTGSHPYRPDPHYAYLGAPMGRAGAMDATLPGGTYKNVWISGNPRPAFAQ